MAFFAVFVPAVASAWTPLAVEDDALVRQPGTQPADAVDLESPRRCLNCHDNFDRNIDPGFYWRGSMMSHATRDPLFWATLTVAAQDSIWALGRPNATDMCIRCHTPTGWLGGRSDPTNGSGLAGHDFDGVSCDGCHRAYDPFFEDTFAGAREGTDWTGYWDESGLGTPTSAAAALTTRAADRTEAATVRLFNGTTFYDAMFQPVQTTWTENGSGQYFMAASNDKRASFTDADARHSILYSRYHKSRYFCQTCHDVSNTALANLTFDGTTPGTGGALPSETDPPFSYFHVERTFSEFALSAYGRGAGATGSGAFAPGVFTTSRPGNAIATCQDCHMPDRSGVGCDKMGAIDRPTGSTEHPQSGQPLHDLTGGNYWIPWVLASTVSGASNYDATNASLLGRPANLTMDLSAGEALDPAALLDGAARARSNLTNAASIETLAHDSASGTVTFRIRNHTGHKLPSGYPEGRRMWVNVRAYTGGAVSYEVNPYSSIVGTLVGLDPAYSPSSPSPTASQRHDEVLVYEIQPSSSLTGESHTFHFALADARNKDNRIPPRGFAIAQAATRLSEPVSAGASAPGLFTSAEYSGGYDAVTVTVPAGADGIEVNLYYQTTSREYVEFLRAEINGTATSLVSPTPSGETSAYIAGTDPFFGALRDWGDTIWQLWDHNKAVPGAAPVLMASATVGVVGDPCAGPGTDGAACNDGDACTTVDVCSGGVCVGGSPVTCMAIDQCHRAGTCNSSTGLCSTPLRPDGATCDDADACTSGDACMAGVCTGSSTVTCTASDQCHGVGTCDPATGTCDDPPLADGTSCNDSDACTTVDACVAGVCTGGSPVTCMAVDQCHRAGTCNPSTGTCSMPNRPDGTSCNDGDACTAVDACMSGVCIGSSAVVCMASDECHVAGACNSATGACSNPPAPNGTACSIGTCQGGVCLGADASVPDGGAMDASAPDGSVPDGSLPDASTMDGSTMTDATLPDGALDAGDAGDGGDGGDAGDGGEDASGDGSADDATADGGDVDYIVDGGGGCRCGAAGASPLGSLGWLMLLVPLLRRRRRDFTRRR